MNMETQQPMMYPQAEPILDMFTGQPRYDASGQVQLMRQPMLDRMNMPCKFKGRQLWLEPCMDQMGMIMKDEMGYFRMTA